MENMRLFGRRITTKITLVKKGEIYVTGPVKKKKKEYRALTPIKHSETTNKKQLKEI